jgi:ectoine hydroxylase-related dioxygenase (phytanoyl-CoA dioxygenase family)
MESIFLDTSLQETFETDGFVVLDHFISDDDIYHFKMRIDEGVKNYTPYSEGAKTSSIEKRPPINDSMVITLLMSVFIQEIISNEIKTMVEASLNKFLKTDYKTAMAFGSVKHPSKEKDGSLVRSHIHASKRNPVLSAFPPLTLFVPLDHIGDSTGPVGFVKSSYKLFENYVIPLEFAQIENVNPHLLPIIDEYLNYQLINAGQAILFHSQTIHKGQSVRDKIRYALTVDLIPNDTEALFYITEFGREGKVTLHGKKMPIPSIYNHGVSNLPLGLGEEIHTVERYDAKEISKEEFIRVCRTP